MRRTSDKRRLLNESVRPWRRELVLSVGKCECCGHSPHNPRPNMSPEMSALCVHEILSGALRRRTLDAPFACLVTCIYCNCGPLMDKKLYPPAKQLALLLASRKDDYDLAAFLKMRNPNAMQFVTQEEVDQHVKELIDVGHPTSPAKTKVRSHFTERPS